MYLLPLFRLEKSNDFNFESSKLDSCYFLFYTHITIHGLSNASLIVWAHPPPSVTGISALYSIHCVSLSISALCKYHMLEFFWIPVMCPVLLASVVYVVLVFPHGTCVVNCMKMQSNSTQAGKNPAARNAWNTTFSLKNGKRSKGGLGTGL